ncbi:MAG: helix-turn-helix domain-containing protein [Phreatobacter sp.]
MEITDDNGDATSSPGSETPHVLANLGEEIRRLRRSRGLRVTELAARIDRSVGFVSQIERGLSKPALKDLYAISVCLGVQVSWFLADPDTAPARERGLIVRRGARRSYEQGGIATEVLSPQMGEELELMISTVQPGATFGKRKAAHTGREAGVVLKGKLEMSIDGEIFMLEEGDSYSYLTTTPHHSRNIGDEPALLLWVVTHF